MKKISIVVPAYNEEGNVEELASQVDLVFQGLDKYDHEIIFPVIPNYQSCTKKNFVIIKLKLRPREFFKCITLNFKNSRKIMFFQAFESSNLISH